MTRVYKQTERRREQKRASRQKHLEKDRARRRVAALAPERQAQKQANRQHAFERSRARARALARVRAGLPASTRPPPALCECCGLPQKGRALALDHCHVSGVFRGWLCSPCNTAIGSLGDSIAGLMNAVRYLERVAEQGESDERTREATAPVDRAGESQAAADAKDSHAA